MRVASASVLGLLAAFTWGCRPVRQQPAPAPLSEAEAVFWQVFQQQQHARLPETITALERAAAVEKPDPRVVLLLGTAYMWAVAEGELAHTTDRRGMTEKGIAALRRYHAMVPADPRLPTWEGPLLAGMGFGLQSQLAHVPEGPQRAAMGAQSQKLIDEALAVLDVGAKAEPRFNLFGRFITSGLLPAATDRFQQAVADVTAFYDVRLGARLDPERPDVTPFLKADSPCDPANPPPWPFAADSDQTTFKLDPKCWNSWKTPFAYEGLWLYAGDILLKGGRTAAARVTYENARKLTSYAKWPYAPYLEQRLAHLDELAARFTDANPANDPELVIRAPANCLVCHASSGQKPIL